MKTEYLTETTCPRDRVFNILYNLLQELNSTYEDAVDRSMRDYADGYLVKSINGLARVIAEGSNPFQCSDIKEALKHMMLRKGIKAKENAGLYQVCYMGFDVDNGLIRKYYVGRYVDLNKATSLGLSVLDLFTDKTVCLL